MRVLKFGGTSVADAEAIRRVIEIVGAQRGARTIVVSALAGVTDALLAIASMARYDVPSALSALEEVTLRHHAVARYVTDMWRRRLLTAAIDALARSARAAVVSSGQAGDDGPSAAQRDQLVGMGELWSSRLVAALLEDTGQTAAWLDARQVVRTDDRHQAATPDVVRTTEAANRLIRPQLALERVVVLGGFIGSAPDGATTTLGRGGSDYSASLLGACLSADEIQIWTDVDGVLTADPRVVAHARPVEWLSYAEAQDLATFGAKVLHPATIQPAAARNIPVRVLNSHRPDAPGTMIGPAADARGRESMTAVACRRGLAVAEVRTRESHDRLAATVFDELARRRTTVVLADVCGGRLRLAVEDSADLEDFRVSVAPYAEVTIRPGLAAVCAVSRGWPTEPQLLRDALTLLGDTPVHMLARASSTSPLAVVVDQAHAETTMTRLHEGFVINGAREACAR